jgi:hypothetical protein
MSTKPSIYQRNQEKEERKLKEELKIWLIEKVLVWFHKISAGNSGNSFWPPGLLIGIYGAVTTNIKRKEKPVKSKDDIHSFI